MVLGTRFSKISHPPNYVNSCSSHDCKKLRCFAVPADSSTGRKNKQSIEVERENKTKPGSPYFERIVDYFTFVKQEADFLRLEYEIENSLTLDEEALDVYKKRKAQLFEKLNDWDNIKFERQETNKKCSCLEGNHDEVSRETRHEPSGITYYCVLIVLNIQRFILTCKRIVNKLIPSL